MKGFGRILSSNGFMELFKSLFKITVVTIVVYITIKARLDEIPTLTEYSIFQIWNFMGEVSLKLMIRVLMTMIFLAGVDFMFQKFTFSKGQRMTKQEVKDERKESEGDPMIKQRIRSAQMQMARKRMMAAVPKADVVVTNPTHISIAIKYDSSQHDVPIVVAKGMGHMAAKIREVAKANGIPLVENKPLARTLYKTVDVGQFIPAALYKAVAEILAYVYRLKGRFTV
jgi:flagellar biosynthetic protein FlhB